MESWESRTPPHQPEAPATRAQGAVLLPTSLSLDIGAGGRVCSEQAFQNNTNLSSSFFSTGVSMMEYLGIGVMGTSGGKFFFRLAPSG